MSMRVDLSTHPHTHTHIQPLALLLMMTLVQAAPGSTLSSLYSNRLLMVVYLFYYGLLWLSVGIG